MAGCVACVLGALTRSRCKRARSGRRTSLRTPRGDETLSLSCACRRRRRVGWCSGCLGGACAAFAERQHLVFGRGKLAFGRVVPCMSHGVRVCRRVARLVCVALCAVGLVATAAGGAAPAASGQAEQAVVFVSDRDGDSDIYGVNLDGTGLTQLTHNDVEDSSPVPSPDGRLIAFYGPTGLAVMNRDGSGRRALRVCLAPASWSPDSTRVACETSPEGIAIADPVRGTVTQISSSGDRPAWSPDGRSIAYVDRALWVVPVPGGPARRVGRRTVDGAPTWSPDSRRLAYAVRVAGRDDLFTISADGSGERRVVKNVEWGHGLEWSPLGSRILFSRYSPRPYVESIYTVRPNGTGLRRVTRSAGGESSRQASWSRDGELLLYERERYNGASDSDLFVTRAGASPGRSLTGPFPSGGTNEEAHWLAGPRLAAAPKPGPRALAVPTARTLAIGGVLKQLAADGARAAVAPGCTIVVWEPLARRTVRMGPVCGETGVGRIVLAGTRVAWTSDSFGNTEGFSEFRVIGGGGRRARLISAASAFSSDGFSTFDSGATVFGLRAAGGTIAFTFSRFTPAEMRMPWLVLPRRGSRCPAGADWKQRAPAICRRLSGGEGGVTAAVDSGRVVVVAPGGVVRLLATGMRVLRTWTLSPPVDEVRLDGRTLAVQRASTVTLYDTETGAATETRPVAANEGTARLLDVGRGLVVYETGGAVHLLRASDVADCAVAIPRAAPPLDAQIIASGLVLTWNRMYDRRPGRLSFVPLPKLARCSPKRTLTRRRAPPPLRP